MPILRGAGHAALPLQDLLQPVELGDLGPHLPGDHSAHQAHETGWLRIQGKRDCGGVLASLGQGEPAGRPQRARGYLEADEPGRVVFGNPVVAIERRPPGPSSTCR